MRWPASLRAIAMVMAIALIFAATPAPATAHGLDVFITYPSGDRAVGSALEVQVLVFSGYQRADADAVALRVGEDRREVPLVRQGTGSYAANITIAEGDLHNGDLLVISADAALGQDSAHDEEYIAVSGRTGFDVSMFVPDSGDLQPTPGEEVEFVVQVTYAGEFVDPDQGTPRVHLVDYPDRSEDVPTSRMGRGIFGGTALIPSVMASGAYDLTANATLTIGPSSVNGSSSLSLSVRTMDVWVTGTDVNGERAIIDVLVMDLYGWPIDGADVELAFGYVNRTGWIADGSACETTDSTGWAMLWLDYRDLAPTESEISFWGVCKHAGLRQGVAGLLHRTDMTEPVGGARPDEFWVTPVTRQLPPGSPVEVTYVAMLNGSPMRNEAVSGYVWDDHGVYWSGTVMTDGNGSFGIPLVTPSHNGEEGWFSALTAAFNTMRDGEVLHAGTEVLYVLEWSSGWQMLEDLDTTTSLRVAPGPGDGAIRFELTSDGADGVDESARVLWGVGNLSGRPGPFQHRTMPDPAPIGLHGHEWQGQAEATWSDGAWRGTIHVPWCVPQLANVFMTATITFFGTPVPYERYAYLENITPSMANDPPVVAFTEPSNGSPYSGVTAVSGTATDGRGVLLVEVRLDGGPWAVAQGAEYWSCLIDAGELPAGNHTLAARAFDGQRYSPVASVEFVVPAAEGVSGGVWLVVVAVVLACMAVAGAAVHLDRRRREGGDGTDASGL